MWNVLLLNVFLFLSTGWYLPFFPGHQKTFYQVREKRLSIESEEKTHSIKSEEPMAQFKCQTPPMRSHLVLPTACDIGGCCY